ncbi:acetyl-CoA acetyltransferase [Streptosporangium becharense]|uniref:Acetyl-CoA acetyltransferase n=1 Tax=Streptosporangium becharense TaxID=1816182 RepID=A0A7W9MFX7_9ACTN|nr:thiolase domain-containing protein [Streptosporangium becharense]MBB2909794.1 acetyl-CoA acetyltransferase [Streptosporangium becharense]MBB5819250.1 acetyl-CoA acetyltransferase [Streptosporangium becharense]
MRQVAVVAFAQTRHSADDEGLSEPEMILPVLDEVRERTGLRRFGFTCSGSCDYLAGAPFSFVSALDALGAWPPISESHVEMDAAWALYEAWVRLQHGDVDSALVYGFGKSSQGDLREIMTLQLDPYYLAPLGLDQVSFAALQAHAAGADRAALDGIVWRSRRDGRANPYALDLPDPEGEEPEVGPLRPYDIAPITDGAAAVVLAAGDLAWELCERPAWISGIAHRIEPHYLGMRDLARSASAADAARAAGVGKGHVDVAELHAQFSHEEIILREALELPDGTAVNPSGGPLAANPVMATGLIRIGEAARRILDGTAGRTVAHAASGPCLQHNLVTVMEGQS